MNLFFLNWRKIIEDLDKYFFLGILNFILKIEFIINVNIL